MKTESWEYAKNSFAIEANSILKTIDAIDRKDFAKAIGMLEKSKRIAASGCGHSGIACMHFAHSMCCIERPARFISPSEALHGAIGFLDAGDAMVLASRGGKTSELLPILEVCKKRQVKVICITENTDSPLALGADVVLKMYVERENDRFNTQGTTSFAVLSAIFDALQVALLEETNYVSDKFAVIHPNGAVGERLNGKRPAGKTKD